MDETLTVEGGTIYDFLDLLGLNLGNGKINAWDRWLEQMGILWRGFQEAKMRHIAAKLCLEPGQCVLDIGSGRGRYGSLFGRPRRCPDDQVGRCGAADSARVSEKRSKLMIRPTLVATILTVVSISMILAWPTGAWAGGDTEAGRKFSETHCSRCHVIGDFNPMGGIGSTPSFQLLAKRDDRLERFGTFFERRPHPVFVRVPGVARWTELPSHVAEFTVTPANIDDIIAFVETLRPK